MADLSAPSSDSIMFAGVILLWSILTAASVVFVAIDIRNTPESAVLKIAFVVITLFTGPIGAFLYVLGCREPLPGLHEQYTAARWRQTLGSTMHCVAGDGIGIVVGAVLAAFVSLAAPLEILLEYLLGFGFGWTIFQALFMRRMSGSYGAALRSTLLPELLSMNALMAAMVPVMMIAMSRAQNGHSPSSPAFWFIMSMSIVAGFVAAYPVNWWLVANHLKHGMMTVRREKAAGSIPNSASHSPNAAHEHTVTTSAKTLATALTFVLLAIGILISVRFARM